MQSSSLLVAGLLAASTLLGLWIAGRGPRQEEALLLTGFGPFAGHDVNPSWEAARRLDGRVLGGYRVHARRLDVAYGRAGWQLRQAIQDVAPQAVLCLGVAPGDGLRVETAARNRDSSPAADVDGVVGDGRRVRKGGSERVATRLPVARLLGALEAAGFEAHTSHDAGGFLCNHAFYVALDEMPPHLPAGFVHVPALEGAWDLERLVRAVELVIRTLAAEPK